MFRATAAMISGSASGRRSMMAPTTGFPSTSPLAASSAVGLSPTVSTESHRISANPAASSRRRIAAASWRLYGTV